jgi:PadR family transcriptional regulator PadR
MNVVTEPSEWLRGVLGICVLRIVAHAPTYGYAIATELAAAGFGDIKGGTLYPLLARLEKNGLVTVDWRTGEGGPGRKYFTLTDLGHSELEQGLDQWRAFSARVSGHLAAGDSDTEEHSTVTSTSSRITP